MSETYFTVRQMLRRPEVRSCITQQGQKATVTVVFAFRVGGWIIQRRQSLDAGLHSICNLLQCTSNHQKARASQLLFLASFIIRRPNWCKPRSSADGQSHRSEAPKSTECNVGGKKNPPREEPCGHDSNSLHLEKEKSCFYRTQPWLGGLFSLAPLWNQSNQQWKESSSAMATTAAARGEEGPAGRPDGRWEGVLWRGGPSGSALASVPRMSLFSGGNSH